MGVRWTPDAPDDLERIATASNTNPDLLGVKGEAAAAFSVKHRSSDWMPSAPCFPVAGTAARMCDRDDVEIVFANPVHDLVGKSIDVELAAW